MFHVLTNWNYKLAVCPGSVLSSELGLSWLEDVSRHHCIVHLTGSFEHVRWTERWEYLPSKRATVVLEHSVQENLKCELAVYWKVSQGWAYASVWRSCLIRCGAAISTGPVCAFGWHYVEWGVLVSADGQRVVRCCGTRRDQAFTVLAVPSSCAWPREASLPSACLPLRFLFLCTHRSIASCLSDCNFTKTVIVPVLPAAWWDSLSLHNQKTEGLVQCPAQDLTGRD